MSSSLDQISAKAASVAGEARVAARHIANIADAAGQMRSRQNVAAEVINGLQRNGDIDSAVSGLQTMIGHCPDADSLVTWCGESQKMAEQIQRANAELQEAVEKAQAQQEAALID